MSKGTLVKSFVKGSGGSVVSGADNTNLDLKGGAIYKFGVIDELVLSSAEVSDSETIIYFTTDSTITFTDNSGVRWGGGNEQPQLEPEALLLSLIRFANYK